jgi:N,N'-diacetyllegionaminate synthase
MRTAVEIAGRRIGEGAPVFIIGEIGVNHNGDAATARDLIDAGIQAGLDAVKFQSFHAGEVAAPDAPKAAYQVETTGGEQSQLEMLKQLELSGEEMAGLNRYCEERGIIFISTACDPRSAGELIAMGVPALKIGSADLTNGLILKECAKGGVPLILSTGLATVAEIERSLRFVRDEGVDEILLMHCITMYPAPPSQLDLRFIRTLAGEFDCPVGFSDHTAGSAAAPVAVAAGACAIEKHFTLDTDMEGPDHRASLEPAELKAMVEKIRYAEQMLGKAVRQVSSGELENLPLVRRSLVFAGDLPVGTRLEYEHLAAKRPGGGVNPMEFNDYVGKVLNRDVRRDEQVSPDDFSTAGGQKS